MWPFGPRSDLPAPFQDAARVEVLELQVAQLRADLTALQRAELEREAATGAQIDALRRIWKRVAQRDSDATKRGIDVVERPQEEPSELFKARLAFHGRKEA